MSIIVEKLKTIPDGNYLVPHFILGLNNLLCNNDVWTMPSFSEIAFYEITHFIKVYFSTEDDCRHIALINGSGCVVVLIGIYSFEVEEALLSFMDEAEKYLFVEP